MGAKGKPRSWRQTRRAPHGREPQLKGRRQGPPAVQKVVPSRTAPDAGRRSGQGGWSCTVAVLRFELRQGRNPTGSWNMRMSNQVLSAAEQKSSMASSALQFMCPRGKRIGVARYWNRCLKQSRLGTWYVDTLTERRWLPDWEVH